MFVDLRAAFEMVDTRTLWETLERRGVRKGLRESIEEVYKETISRVKVGGEVGEKFWIAKGVRQGCPMSAYLFNMLTADMEEELRKGRWGGVKIREQRICTLAYADDVAVIAENEEEMESMIRRLERYFDNKKLEVNVEKTKVMRFRK